jgi:hypothetical protein
MHGLHARPIRPDELPPAIRRMHSQINVVAAEHTAEMRGMLTTKRARFACVRRALRAVLPEVAEAADWCRASVNRRTIRALSWTASRAGSHRSTLRPAAVAVVLRCAGQPQLAVARVHVMTCEPRNRPRVLILRISRH